MLRPGIESEKTPEQVFNVAFSLSQMLWLISLLRDRSKESQPQRDIWISELQSIVAKGGTRAI